MWVLKYILFSLLFIFNKNIELLDIGIFTITSLTLSFVAEIKNNFKVNNFLIIIYGIFMYFFPISRFFIFPFLYAIYKVDLKNAPIFLVFAIYGEWDFLLLSVLISLFGFFDSKYNFEILKGDDEKLRFHKEKHQFINNLKNLHFEEEKNKHNMILKEREEISKKLHNSVGHTISASIMELYAISLGIDEETKREIDSVREKLSVGMGEIRDIIHNMYNSSFDLEGSIQKILDISGKNTHLTYRVQSQLNSNLIFDILSIVKESANNFLKYSNGNNFYVKFIETEKFFVLTIWDDGIVEEVNKNGIGLVAIRDISQKHGGNCNIITENGFKINITFNKE